VGLGGCLPHANVITLALAPVFSSCLHPDLLAPVTGSPVSDICRSCRLICQLSRRPKLRPLPPANHPGTQLAPHPNPRPSIQNPESRTHRNQTWASSSTGTASFYACWVNSCLPTTASSAFHSTPLRTISNTREKTTGKHQKKWQTFNWLLWNGLFSHLLLTFLERRFLWWMVLINTYTSP